MSERQPLKLSNKIKVTGFEQKSKSRFSIISAIEVGDVLELSVKIRSIGRGGNGLYATEVKIANLSKPEIDPSIFSLTQISKYLSNILYEEVDS